MLVFETLQLVYLAVPKTATQSVQAALRPHAAPLPKGARNHMPLRGFDRHLRADLEARTGRAMATLAVVRDPVDRLRSWFQFRQREEILHRETSTAGIDFDEFLQARIAPKPPKYARIGSQATFVGWTGDQAGVDYLFDFARLDLLEAFFSKRLGQPIRFDPTNTSPSPIGADLAPPSADILARLRQKLPGEFALYDAVRGAGCLRSQKLSSLAR